MSETILSINSAVSSFVWVPVMLVLLVGIGVYMTVRTGFFQFRDFKDIFNHTIGAMLKKDERNKNKGSHNILPFQAMTAAIASSVGVGSIAGVATAVVTGGSGAVFWMCVSALFGMMTKYSEVVLSVYYRRKGADGIHYGGPMYYIESGLRNKPLAKVFAVCAGIACFGAGNMTQANSIANSFEIAFAMPTWLSGGIVAVWTALVIFGGVTRIAKTTEKLVHFMASFYLIGALIVVLVNYTTIPLVCAFIFEGAFSLKAVGGGVMGYAFMQAMRFGTSRGVFSNEAGLGTAPMLHATANTNNPVRQGMWGIFEVFVTTIMICTLTALVVLTSGLVGQEGLQGAGLTASAFSQVFGNIGNWIVAIFIFCFAFSSILGWAYYGETSWKYLIRGRDTLVTRVFRIVWIPAIFLGSVARIDLIWALSDSLNGIMIIPNLVGCLDYPVSSSR
ncbi:alanine/glycine:cation symporter family protein [Eubacterium aggregans]|uniref:alanine/glycine:cation symporter family protein n=1 Tax=Eubacterium aggregans TaxID=81409 RepID=UPI003F349DD4